MHRPCPDWGGSSRWERLKSDRKRPLWVVYDEAHNTTTDQVELLDDLNPAGFFVASASPIRGKLQLYLTALPVDVRATRIIPVSTRAVVDAQLLKSTISLADYDSSQEEMILDVVTKRDKLESQLRDIGSPIVPKAIYVVETSNTVKGQEPRPASIWRTLVNQGKVPAEQIAVCTNTKELPKEAVRVATIDQLSDSYPHIIFNKKLQEGWDDPSVYLCYFDGKTGSATRVQQVLGRAVRQPGVRHFSDDDLNTAPFLSYPPERAAGKDHRSAQRGIAYLQGRRSGLRTLRIQGGAQGAPQDSREAGMGGQADSAEAPARNAARRHSEKPDCKKDL